jgi:transketolase
VALHEAREASGKPKAIVLRTTPGRGVPTLERRERAHFVRIEPGEWNDLISEFEQVAGTIID